MLIYENKFEAILNYAKKIIMENHSCFYEKRFALISGYLKGKNLYSIECIVNNIDTLTESLVSRRQIMLHGQTFQKAGQGEVLLGFFMDLFYDHYGHFEYTKTYKIIKKAFKLHQKLSPMSRFNKCELLTIKHGRKFDYRLSYDFIDFDNVDYLWYKMPKKK